MHLAGIVKRAIVLLNLIRNLRAKDIFNRDLDGPVGELGLQGLVNKDEAVLRHCPNHDVDVVGNRAGIVVGGEKGLHRKLRVAVTTGIHGRTAARV